MTSIRATLMLSAMWLAAPARATDFSDYEWQDSMDGPCAFLDGGNLVLHAGTLPCGCCANAAMLAPLPGTFTLDLNYVIDSGLNDGVLAIYTTSGGYQFTLYPLTAPSQDIPGISVDVMAGDEVSFWLSFTEYSKATECTFSNLQFTPEPGVTALGGSLDDGVLFAFEPASVLEGGPGLEDRLVALDDVDGDGQGDFAFSQPYASSPTAPSAGVVILVSGGTLETLQLVYGAGYEHHLGDSLANLGDVDGDGIDDVAVSEPGWPSLVASLGRVRVLSGATGAQLYTLDGTTVGAAFADSVGGAGDTDGDGRGDIVVSAPLATNGAGGLGAVFLYSGATQAKLHTIWGDNLSDYLGWSVGGAGDANADGLADFFVTSRDYPSGLKKGLVRIFSGADASVLHSFVGEDSDPLGADVAAAGDFDADGHDDLVVSDGMASLMGGLWSLGVFRVYSGATGAVLLEVTGSEAYEQLGFELAGAGDLNGDGFDDILASGRIGPAGTGSVTAYAGPSGAVLFELYSVDASFYGYRIAGGKDLDADATPDVLVAAKGVGFIPAGARISGISGELAVLDPPVLSAAGALLAGSPLTLVLTDGPDGGVAFLLVGLEYSGKSFKSGLLVPSPDLLMAFALQPDGSLSLATSWPAGLASPLAILLQAWCPSARAANGFTASNAVMLAPP